MLFLEKPIILYAKVLVRDFLSGEGKRMHILLEMNIGLRMELIGILEVLIFLLLLGVKPEY